LGERCDLPWGFVSSAMESPAYRRLLYSSAAVIFGVMGQAVARGWLARDLTGNNTGLGGVMLFGVPESKDATGSGALDPDGILNVAIADVKAEVGDAVTVMSDLCLDEFTDHGHCGVLDSAGRVDNDATLEVYAEMARAHAAANPNQHYSRPKRP